ncbi:GPCR kinase [Tanacetum coccineum]
MGGSSSGQQTHQPMSPISSFPTVEDSVDEHEIGDEFLIEGYLTEKEQQQLLLDEEALRETLEEQARAEKDEEKVVEDEDFKTGSWVSATDYVNANDGTVSGGLGDIKNFLNNWKLDQVVAIVKSCSPNVIGDLMVTMKDLSSTIPGTIHHKVIGEGGYGKEISVGAALILANVSVFSPKPSMYYLNITIRNVVKVFRKDTVPISGSG